MFRLNLTTTLSRTTPVLRSRIFLGLSSVFVIASRLLTVNGLLPSPESVNFALALHHYDLASQSPPLPGYPVYIFLARIFTFFGLPDGIALSLPGILSAGLAVVPLYNLVKRLHGEEDAKLAVLLFITNPGIWILSLRPSYSALMLFPFLLALRMFLRIVLLPPHLKHQTRFLSFYTGTLALGLLCGITFDTLFLFVPLLLFSFYGMIKLKRTRIMLEMINGIIVGLCLWAVPFFFSISIADIIARPESGDIAFVSASSAAALGLLGKIKLFAWDILSFGFMAQVPWWVRLVPGAVLVLALFLALKNMRLEYKYFFLLTFFLPYVLFLLFFRNLSLPGNTILLMPMVMVFVSAGLATLGKKAFYSLAMVLVIFSLGIGVQRAAAYKTSRPPQVQMAEWLRSEADPEGSVLFGGSSARVVRYYASALRTYALADAGELNKPFNRKIMKDKTVYLVSDLKGISGLKGALSPVKVFPPQPYLYGKSDTLVLYTLLRSAVAP